MTVKNLKALLCAALFVVQASACRAQVPVRWYAESSRPTKQVVPVYQGETILLQPTMQSYGSDITNLISATLYWQTNNMEQAWWTKPAEIIDGQISATFHPTNDCGAAAYTFFIGSSAGLGTSYRAFGTFRMQSAPGFLPAVANTPTLWPSMATDLLPSLLPLLPEYEPLGSTLALSNALAAAIAPLATTGSVSLAVAADAGNFAGTEIIKPYAVQASWFEAMPHVAVTGKNNFGAGLIAMKNVAGNSNTAVGSQVMENVTGNQNKGFGSLVLRNISGDYNLGFGENVYNDARGNHNFGVGYSTFISLRGSLNFGCGRQVLMESIVTNVFAFGQRSGYRARGENKVFIDNSHSFLPAVDNAFYLDNGQLNLGRGSFAPATPNRLRGAWEMDDGLRLDQLADTIAAIPQPPTNAVAGWLIYDSGSNMWLRVSSSNFCVTLEEFLP